MSAVASSQSRPIIVDTVADISTSWPDGTFVIDQETHSVSFIMDETITPSTSDVSNIVNAGVTSTIWANTCRYVVQQLEIALTGVLEIKDTGRLEIG